jgi:hypothetical protein
MTPAFEQFARSKGWPTWRKPDGKTYIDTRVQFAAEAWQAREVPAGFVVVPVEPTEEMGIAGALAHQQSACHDFIGPIDSAWSAMLAAAPQQPASLEGGR